MQPDTSHWKSADHYDYINDLTVEGLAWEFLRRNPEYQQDYLQYAKAAGDAAADAAFTQQWGLRFPGEAKPHQLRAADILVAIGR